EQPDAMESIREQASEVGFDIKAHLYAVGIMRIYQQAEHNERELLRFLQMVQDNIFSERLKAFFLQLHEKQIVVFFVGTQNNELSFRRDIIAGMQAANDSLEKYYDYKIDCVVGGTQDCFENLTDSYVQALSVWKTVLMYAAEPIFYDDVVKQTAKDKQTFERPRELEQQLLRNIQMGREDMAEESLYEILRYYEGMHVTLSEFVSVSLVELVFEISETLQKAGGQNPVWEDRDVTHYLKEHFAYGSLKDAQQVLQTYVAKCCAQFAVVNEKQGDRIVFLVKDLIEKNLDNEELSLESVSGMLFFSPNYVRQIFKQITGESFMAYLIRRRMETAKQLLANEALKIQDIAMQTGYSNQRYFASCFKKYYGCTPTEYRGQLHS
ncbi:MAG: helix-turn-helix transcriptional regulator, partial [Acetatifactor sp.]|nr:helix-turn-helix transcriptional regulator [Acetatifactor sp.]